MRDKKKSITVSNQIISILFSHKILVFSYGTFLLLYQLSFVEQLISRIHPVLIIWSFVITVNDIFVRRIWERVPFWKPLLLFILSAGLTALLTREAGLVNNIKVWIMTMLPVLLFYPVCLLENKDNNIRTFLTSMLGAASVMSISSVISIWMYVMRFSREITFMGTTHTIGIRHYVPEDPSSAIILYGIYKDTNYAASYALVFIFYSLILLYFCHIGGYKQKWKKRIACVFAIFNLIVQIAYFPLANSRGGWVSLCLSIFMVLFLVVFNRQRDSRNVCGKIFLSLLCSVSVIVVCCLFLMAVRTGLSALSVKVELFRLSKPQESQSAEDNLIENTSIENKVEPEVQDGQEIPNNIDMPIVNEKKTAEIQVEEDSFVKKNVNIGAGRLEIWKDALKLFQHRPIFGEGGGNNIYYAKKYLPESSIALSGKMLHNSYLDLLVDYGIVGTIFLMSFWIECMISVLRYLFKEKGDFSAFSYFCIAIMLVGACSAFFLSYLFVNTTAMYFLLLVSTGGLMVECISDDC